MIRRTVDPEEAPDAKAARWGTIAIIAVVFGAVITSLALGYLLYTSYQQQHAISVLSNALTAQRQQFDTCKAEGSATNPNCQQPIAPAPSQITKGLTSAAGPKGDQGPIGPQGPQGVQGPEGPIGPIGPQGIKGLTGKVGANGTDGKNGPVGPAGAEGAPGADGGVGPAGPQGPAGPVGPAGPAGPPGAQGTAGADGTNGTNGQTPTQMTCTKNQPVSNDYDCVVTAWK